MKNLSLSFLLLFIGILNFYAQEADFEYISSSESPYEAATSSEVLRNTSETYVRLSWPSELCTQGCIVEFTNVETDELQTIEVDGTSFDMRQLATPNQYSWRVLKKEGPNTLASNWETFTTDYMSPVQTHQELSNVLKSWKDNTSEYSNLEAYLRDQKGLNSEIMETFIMNFYKGVPPSLNPSGSRNDCNCEFVVTDNVYFSAPETYSYNQSDDSPWCGHWKRYNTSNTRYGAAKNMQMHLTGRLKSNQKEEFIGEEFMSYAALTVQYMCDQDECCDADYKIAARIDQNLYGHGNYANSGGYRIDVADLAFIVESRDGVAELLATPSAKALTVYENTTVNPEFWSGIFDLVVSGLANYQGILELDPEAAEALLDAVENVIGVQALTQVVGDDNGNVINGISTTPTLNKSIGANETVTYGVFSNSKMSYKEAWGKKLFCNKGHITVDAHIKTGYSIAISSKSNDEGECCRNDYAKWVTGSYLGAANAQTMLAEAGLVVGCNGGEWKDNNGNTIACPNSDPLLTTAIGIVTKDNDCCVSSEINTDLDIEYTCLQGEDGNSKSCTRCKLGKFNISIPNCQDGNQHSITITEQNAFGINTVVYQNNNITTCDLEVILSLKFCRKYTLLYSVVGECTNETSTTQLIKTCCTIIKNDGDIKYDFQSGDDDDSNTRNSKISSDIDLKIFPNPSTDYVTFSANSNAPSSLQVIGIEGKLIFTKNLKANEELRLPTSDIGNGIFIARLMSNNKITAAKKFTILN